MTEAHNTELKYMAEDRELSAPYRKAAADGLAEIARLRALIADLEDGDTTAAFLRGVAHGQNIVRGKTFHVVDSPELVGLRADLAAAVAAKEKAEGALENLMIAIGMGWDLEGVIEQARAAMPDAKGEKPINWAKDPDAIVEDDEPQIGRDYA